jgi:hypothetical protein
MSSFERWVLFHRALGAKTPLLPAQFGRKGIAEILRGKDLPDFDLGTAIEWRALHPIDRLLARISNARALELGCSPSPANTTPALNLSSLNFPMAVSNSVLGITPASLFLSAFTITMNRIAKLRLAFHFARRRFRPPAPQI